MLNKQIKKRKGFTLAEVLITLGIIGIVATMVMPSLINTVNDQKRSVILRQDYAILAQLFLKANDSGAAAMLTEMQNMNQMKMVFDQYFLQYISPVKVCYDETGCWTDSITKYLNGQNAAYFSSGKVGTGVIYFTMANGTVVAIDDYAEDDLWAKFGVRNPGISTVLFLDVNGKSPPNVFGKDTFVFVVSENGELIPAGHDKTASQVRQNCRLSGTGAFCPELLKVNNYRLQDLITY